MTRRILAVALVAVAAFAPAAHADPLEDVKEVLERACQVDLCIPPQPFFDRVVCPFLDETPVYDCS